MADDGSASERFNVNMFAALVILIPIRVIVLIIH